VGSVAGQAQMVMVVIPNNKSDAYSVTKKICCIEKPVPSQVVTATIIGKEKGKNERI
jgi:aubergine-like protein